MGFGSIWIVLALACALAVLVWAGALTRDPATREGSIWVSWWRDLIYALEPVRLRISILALHLWAKINGRTSVKAVELKERYEKVRIERRRERDIAKMSSLDAVDESNSTLDEFFNATQTNEPAYVGADPISDTLESLYETVQERRSHRVAGK
ncbi:hypothetical protein [Timonella sp. A28]|uniref:hypothetical protein n=1 Tax=Timonella sp. A28 TaxID=3442640 RepID=UPI003EBDEA5A